MFPGVDPAVMDSENFDMCKNAAHEQTVFLDFIEN